MPALTRSSAAAGGGDGGQERYQPCEMQQLEEEVQQAQERQPGHREQPVPRHHPSFQHPQGRRCQPGLRYAIRGVVEPGHRHLPLHSDAKVRRGGASCATETGTGRMKERGGWRREGRGWLTRALLGLQCVCEGRKPLDIPLYPKSVAAVHGQRGARGADWSITIKIYQRASSVIG